MRHTPVLPSATLSEAGGEVVLKAESLQRTGAFKLRGALAKLAALGEACAGGVVAGSAGNHAQALAHAARARGVPCEVFMPSDASIAKAEGAEALGATVRLVGTSVEECMEAARERAREAGLTFVHPFDDPDVIAGQGTVGLELLEDVPDLAKVIVPVGGGGLASGTAIAVKSARPEVEVVGVQVEAFSPFPESMRTGEPVTVPASLTIADGIAVKRPGELTLALMREWVDDVVTVGEDDVAEAMVMLLEKAKLVVEGAGAVGVAALLAGRTSAAERGATVVILSGGQRGRRPPRDGRAPPRDRGGPAPRRPHPAARTGPVPWPDCSGAWGRRARTCSTSSTSARRWSFTSARRRCSSCSRPAGPSTRSR